MSRPLSDRILVRCERTAETSGGILIPEAQRVKLNKGTIEAIGPKVQCSGIQPWRQVIFKKGSGVSIDDERQLIREEDVSLVIE